MTVRLFHLRHMMPPRAVTLTSLVISIALSIAHAQSPADRSAAVSFEVASIRRNTSGEPARARIEPSGRFTAVGAPILQIIRQAYDVLEMQVANVPDWFRSERYDIQARAPQGVELGRAIGPLLRSLLEERFALRSHFESRELPIYELLVLRQDGGLGARLKKSTADCTANPQAVPRDVASDEPPCAQFGTIGRRVMRGFPMSRIAQMLTGQVGRVVVDKTGLLGTWNLELEFAPNDTPAVPPGGLPPGITLPSLDAPDLFTALREQLGLRLDAARGPVQVLVIDGIERPSDG